MLLKSCIATGICLLLHFVNVDATIQQKLSSTQIQQLGGAATVQTLAAQWEPFKSKFAKTYANDTEEVHRFTNFANNYQFIQTHNADTTQKYKMGLNHFADQTIAEMRVRNGYKPQPASAATSARLHRFRRQALPASIDWRSNNGKNIVTPVKDQGQCGDCFAFASTGALEGQNALKCGTLVSLSEEQITDCSSAYGNQGCNGGNMAYVYQYVHDDTTQGTTPAIRQLGLDTETDYPYTAGQTAYPGTCKYGSITPNSAGTGNGFVNVAATEAALEQAVATIGPISVAIDAGSTDAVVQAWNNYASGVYTGPCTNGGNNVDHAVLVVGYGTDPTAGPYWIIKNQWSTNWGMNGYMYLARNSNNLCAVASNPTYPISTCASTTTTTAAPTTTKAAPVTTTQSSVVTTPSAGALHGILINGPKVGTQLLVPDNIAPSSELLQVGLPDGGSGACAGSTCSSMNAFGTRAVFYMNIAYFTSKDGEFTIFDPNTRTTKAGPKMAAATFGHAATEYNQAIVVCGGCTSAGDVCSAACEQYSIGATSWTPMPPMPGTGVQDFVLLNLDTYGMFAMGGWNGYVVGSDTAAVHKFDGTTWTTKTNMMSGPIHAHAGTWFGVSTVGLVCGGLVKNVPTKTCYTYASANDMWSLFPSSLNTARSWHGMVIYNGSPYVFGGSTATTAFDNTVEKYTANSGGWQVLTTVKMAAGDYDFAVVPLTGVPH